MRLLLLQLHDGSRIRMDRFRAGRRGDTLPRLSQAQPGNRGANQGLGGHTMNERFGDSLKDAQATFFPFFL